MFKLKGMLSAGLALFLGCLVAGPALAQDAPIALGHHRELFVDSYLIDQMDGVSLKLQRPCYAGKALTFDAPWEGRFCGYVTVFHDGDTNRMYYRGMPVVGKDSSAESVTCYAESPDGIHWKKPDLGLYEVHGTKKNNVTLAHMPPFSHNFCPFLDSNPKAKKSQRYKALAGTGKSGLHGFVSPDGIHWSPLQKAPLITEGAFDSQNVSFWSTTEGRYVCYFRTWSKGEFSGYRTISRTTSPDFIHWTKPAPMHFGDTPMEHLYTNQTQPYFRAPQIYIALPMRFMPGRRVLTASQAKSLGVFVKPGHPGQGYASDCADTVFMTSRGGMNYDRTFMEAYIRPGADLGNWASRAGMAACGIVQTGDTELSIYKQFHYAQPTAYLGRYTLRLDGFTSVNAPYEGGEFLTKPFTFKGSRLVINFATSAAGEMEFEFVGPDGTPKSGFTEDDCRPVIGDQVDREVAWKSGPDVSSLAGKPVRLRVVMRDADLYSIQFR